MFSLFSQNYQRVNRVRFECNIVYQIKFLLIGDNFEVSYSPALLANENLTAMTETDFHQPRNEIVTDVLTENLPFPQQGKNIFNNNKIELIKLI